MGTNESALEDTRKGRSLLQEVRHYAQPAGIAHRYSAFAARQRRRPILVGLRPRRDRRPNAPPSSKPLKQIDAIHRLVRRYPETFALALTADDIVRRHKEGKIASLIGIEGGHSIDNSLGVAAYAVRARRPLHDADPQRQPRLGGRRDR